PWIMGLALSPDGRHALTGGKDKTARVWDLDTGQERLRLTHRAPVWGTAYSPDGRLIATASPDGVARVWDARTGTPVTDDLPLRSKEKVAMIIVAFSRDSRYVVAAAYVPLGRGEARVWEVGTGRQVGPPLERPAGFYTAEISPDNRRVLTAGEGVLL